jgi:hypothetical protein
MALNLERPSKSCPYPNDPFTLCERCGYLEDRKVSPYLKRIRKALNFKEV